MSGELTSQVLESLIHSNGPVLSSDAFPSVQSVTIKSALDRLASRQMISYKALDREEALLTAEGEDIANEGSHEAKVFEAVRKSIGGLRIVDLPVRWLSHMPLDLGELRGHVAHWHDRKL